ncbi:energy transducer TonB [Novosphingobium sp.]|uniref:energy transducer TonB n=1 Tax=Novosphingobium sp. TaxID=1874826 RepID=UPI0035B2D769
MRYWTALPLIALIAQASAESAAAPVLQPQGPWKEDYANEECRLVRAFGTGPEMLTVQISRGSGFQEFSIAMAGTAIPKLPQTTKVTLRLLEQGQEQQFEAQGAHIPDRPEGFVRLYGGGSNIIAEFSDDQTIGIAFGTRSSVSVKLPGVRKAVAALDACHADLLKSWGVDVDKLKAAKVPPRALGNPGYWVTTNDYPVQALSAGKGGNVVFLLDVDAKGKPTSCSVTRSSGVPQLDERTCRLVMHRARFDAARNAEGQPIVGHYVSRVRWIIPN